MNRDLDPPHPPDAGAELVPGVLGRSPALRAALASFAQIRDSDATVHVRGETGTGKEIIARALHEGGPRRSRRFVVQNCATLSDELVHSTLFGHRRGAFTGAHRDHAGAFAEADGGSLFLDEVAELSPSAQASLLRVLQSGEVVPLGETRPRRVNVRLISATHKSLRAEVKAGRFREDLFFRLMVLSIRLPPLRERREDIPLLARAFLDETARRTGRGQLGFTAEAMEQLCVYPWPGNVRELQNEIARVVVLAPPGGVIDAALLTPRVQGQATTTGFGLPVAPAAAVPAVPAEPEGVWIPFSLEYDAALRMLRYELVRHALLRAGGVTAHAARLLGMERTRLVKERRRLGLDGDADEGIDDAPDED